LFRPKEPSRCVATALIDEEEMADVCFVLIGVDAISDVNVAVAANREEFFLRPTIEPALQTGPPRVVCGVDARAGGTWLGVNEHRLFVAVTNRYDKPTPTDARSRGQLCRQALDADSLEQALSFAESEIAGGRYAGVNVVIAKEKNVFVVHGGGQQNTVHLPPGFHALTNGDVDDAEDQRHRWARQAIERHAPANRDAFLLAASAVCSEPFRHESASGVVLRGID
jgi:uncharacterized protein with NRDE domain